MLDNKATAKNIQKDMIAALATVAKNYGVEFVPNGGRIINSGELLLKVKVKLAKSNPEQAKSEKAEWDYYCALYGLTPGDYGKVVSLNGDFVKLIGFRPPRRKYPVLGVKLANNKQFLYNNVAVVGAVKYANNCAAKE
jgi:hypothetical protein